MPYRVKQMAIEAQVSVHQKNISLMDMSHSNKAYENGIYTPECILLLLCPCMLAATIYLLWGVSPTAYIIMCSYHESIPSTGHIYSCGCQENGFSLTV